MPGRWGQYGEIFRAVCSNFLLIVPIGIALPGAAAGEEEGNETHDSKYRANVLIRKMVRAGKLGIKSGEGFFNYKK